MGIYTPEQRQSLWKAWNKTISQIAEGDTATDIDSDHLDMMRKSLRDIPLRDALLANTVHNKEQRPAMRELFAILSENEDIPSLTILGAIQFLDDDKGSARATVGKALDLEEYSLARLLDTGLQMDAPAPLLARSFGHFSAEELLNEKA